MTEFTCEQFAEQLFEFVEGHLADFALISIHAHLGQCPHCGRMVATYRATVLMTRALPRANAKLPEGMELRLRTKMFNLNNEVKSADQT